MKVGDLVKVKDRLWNQDQETPQVWNNFMGEVGVVIDKAKRRHIPAVKVMMKGKVVEFDIEELESINESR